MKATVIIQSFGKEHEYRRAILCIFSLYAQLKNSPVDFETIVFTDKPAFFGRFLDGLPVRFELLTADTITRMRGPQDFLHRMKIAIIEKAFDFGGDVLFYIDSDAFFLDDPTPVVTSITERNAFMHCAEYAFDTLESMELPAGKPFHDFLQLLRTQTFTLHDGTAVQFPTTLFSWNAGVIVLPASARHLLPDVYALTDQFFLPTSNHAAEQYAFSLVLQTRMTLHDCERYVHHYWYRVKKKIVDAFLAQRLTENWAKGDLSSKMYDVRKLTDDLPRFIETHGLTYKDNAIQSFHVNAFGRGYRYAGLALLKGYANFVFFKDVLYHTKRMISGRR